MGKNKIRSKDRQRKEKASISDNSGPSFPSTSTSAYGNVITTSTSNTFDRRHPPAAFSQRDLGMLTASLPNDADTSDPSSGTSPATPMSRRKYARDKRDSVISITWETPRQHSKPKANPVKQPLWRFKPGSWWPCRALQWTYHFFVALVRVHWTEKQTLQDLIFTLVLIGMVIASGYAALDFLLRALSGVAAQALDGNCSVVYVTVPGPIITVSLIGASPTNPARGTYYFSVINGTTEWLNSIAPPSRSSTLVTRTAEITPIVSSSSTTGTSSSGVATVSSTQTPTASALPIPGPSTPGLDRTLTSSLLSGSTVRSFVGTSVFGSTPSPPSLTSSSVSLSPFGSSSSETASLPRPINQPQRPYPSYSVSTSVVAVSSGLSTTVFTLSTLLLPSTVSVPSSTSLSSVVLSSSLPGLSPNMPSSTLGGISSQPTIGSGLPLTSGVLTTLTTSLSSSSTTITTDTTNTAISSMLYTRSDGFTVSLPRPSSGSTLSGGISSSISSLLSSSPSFSSSLGRSSFTSSRGLSSSLDTTSGVSSDSSTPPSSTPTLISSVESSLITLSLISTTPLSSLVVISSLTSGSTASLDSSSTPLTSVSIPSTSTGFATLLPDANSSSLSKDSTFSSALLISSTTTSSTVGSSSLASSLTLDDGILSIQTDTIVSGSLPSSSIVSPSTQTSTLTLTTTTSPVVTSPSASGLKETSSFLVRAVTKVISFGDAAVSFVFPSPNITTTMSYWTGLYPTVTGPLPSDLQTVPLTTRTERQTPLSALPSFEMFSSRPRRFKTVVTRIFEECDESTTALARRQDIPITAVEPTQMLETTMLATTMVALPDLPGPSSCGESGNFTLTFDDTVVGDDNNMLLVANGMTNPYHHLFYANGYTYVPDKWEPYPAISQPNIAMFLPLTGRLLPNTPFAGMMLPGELGAGPRASVDAYWFNAYSAYFGCALSGLEPCTLRVSGYRYDAVLKEEVLVAEQNATIPACWSYINCHLTQIFFSDQFRALSGIQFNAYTYLLGIPQVHMMDDVQMEWYNNSCSAGILRIGHS